MGHTKKTFKKTNILKSFLGCLDESQSFLFIPLLQTRSEISFDDLEETISAKSVLVIFETLSYFPGSSKWKIFAIKLHKIAAFFKTSSELEHTETRNM